jgi:hypothetical protein
MKEIDRFKFGTIWRDDQFDGETAFRNMRRAFAEAVTSEPNELLESFYLFAGRAVRVRVLGRELAEHIDRPFSHLRTDGPVSRPQLTIELWDAHRTRRGFREEPFNSDAGWHEKTVKSGHERFVGQQLPHTVSCLDRRSAHIMGSIAWHSRIFIYERAKPLARLLLHWHNDVDVQVIHTALVARANNGLLLAGKSGSGKSTSSLACVMAGFDYLSEDYVGLQVCGDDSFVGHSLYNSVFLNTDHLGRFAQLAPYAIRGRPPHEEKSAVILSQIFPQRLTRAVRIRALVLPHVIDAPDAQLRPVSKGEALLALGPSSLLQIPNRGLGTRGFERLARLVERTPCFRMSVGSNLASIPRCLDALLATITSS